MDIDDISREFMRDHEADCSYVLMRWWQTVWYGLLFAVMLFSIAYRWDVFLCVVNFVLAFWYFSIIFFRSVVTCLSAAGLGQVRVSDEEIAQLNEADLPVYTILVPLYREANVSDRCIASLNKLDYPRDKLDIKLLLEDDDGATIEAVRGIDLPSQYEVIVVPDFQPKTKPKACNYGLRRARGEICVIYDAEDRPEPDQLKKVVCAFRRLPEKIVCLQAKLNYYNPDQNLLTRWFTVEYGTTFDLYLPGLQCVNVPIPLGGTSNHFRAKVLKRIGGWDPFNVTEDCDLGVRIYKCGYKTMMIDSTTWEEANSRLWNWIRQRSRWIKGFFQTHLTHMRHPFRTFCALGPWGFFGFLLNVGGSSLMMVLNVIYWMVGWTYLFMMARLMVKGYGLFEIVKGPRPVLGDSIIWPMLYYGPDQDVLWSSLSVAFFVITCVLLLANLLFVFMHVLACIKRGYYRLLPYAVTMPIYWVLISVGAWKGFIQLFTNLYYWEKTIHGLDGQGSMKST